MTSPWRCSPTSPTCFTTTSRQRFAQVTNPPIDPQREKLVMSLEMHLGERRPALKPQPEAASGHPSGDARSERGGTGGHL